MNRYGVVDAPRVAAGEHDDERNVRVADGVDDAAIAKAQTILGQPKAAELIVFVGIRAGEIEHALRTLPEHLRERAIELAQVRLIAGAVR